LQVPFPPRSGEAGTRHADGAVLIALRTDPKLSDDDFREFFRAQLEPRRGFDVKAWAMAIVGAEGWS
jgi:hypothetical protein